MDPPGQPLHRRLSRYFWEFPPFLALVETIALAVHFQDMDMVGEAVQQSPGQAFRAEYLRPLIERQVGGHQVPRRMQALSAGGHHRTVSEPGSAPPDRRHSQSPTANRRLAAAFTGTEAGGGTPITVRPNDCARLPIHFAEHRTPRTASC